MKPEIEEFARILVKEVRDRAIQACDAQLETRAKGPVARRWRDAGVVGAKIVIPDCVDKTIAALLRAIDDGELQVRFVAADGKSIDLSKDGLGELVGWYMGSAGWRTQMSDERAIDDFADI